WESVPVVQSGFCVCYGPICTAWQVFIFAFCVVWVSENQNSDRKFAQLHVQLQLGGREATSGTQRKRWRASFGSLILSPSSLQTGCENPDTLVRLHFYQNLLAALLYTVRPRQRVFFTTSMLMIQCGA
ncbi:unnamed protein product, partial [Amoebophrya sp. A120]